MFRGTLQCFSFSLSFGLSLSITEPGSIFFIASLGMFASIDKISLQLSFLQPNSPNSSSFQSSDTSSCQNQGFLGVASQWYHSMWNFCKSSLVKYSLIWFSYKKGSLLLQTSAMVSAIWEPQRPSSLVKTEHNSTQYMYAYLYIRILNILILCTY